MKKIIAMALALAMVLALAACNSSTNTTNPPTDPPVTDTSWNCVEGYNFDKSNEGVWQYFFFDATDSSYNPMGDYADHSDFNVKGWYPWEGSWVGVGFNSDVPDTLELNNEGKDGMRAVLGFCAPADGKYVFSGTVSNPWSQKSDVFTISVNGEAKVSVNVLAEVNATYHIDGTEIEMKKGDIAYIECTGTTAGEWVSTYVNIDVALNGEAAAYEAPTDGAIAEWSKENSNGTWVYAYTADGKEYNVISDYKEEDWAHGWFTPNGLGLDFQTNPEFGKMIECNVKDNNEEITALGYKAPFTGKFTMTIYTKCYTEWGQSGHAVVSLNGEDVATLPLGDAIAECTVELSMKKDEVAYIHGVTDGGWLCTFLSVQVQGEEKEVVTMPEGVGAAAEFNEENADGTWVYAATSDGKAYTVNTKFDTPDWDSDGKANAAQWYSEGGTGIGKNYDMPGYIEANVTDNNGEMTALGYKAAADGTYKLTVYAVIRTDWGQAGHIVVSLNGEDIQTIENSGDLTATVVEVSLKAGEVVYVHGVTDGGWLSTYVNVVVG